MDFIEGLPKSRGKDIIWVVVDILSKYTHFIALSHPMTSTILAQSFIDRIYRLHGALENVVIDRDPLFISNFWKEFLSQLGITQNMSFSYHPQSDEQSEVVNWCLENYLRLFVWHNQHSWCKWLPLVEW